MSDRLALVLLFALVPCLARAAAPARAPLIVIDPGHGGTNRGAFGPALGLHEKHLTLKLARMVAGELRRRQPRLRVRLTRDDDRYLTLQQRGELANRWQADLFVSIHFNASESRSQRGFESYVLAGAAADHEVRRLARPASAQGAAADDLATILAELRLTVAHRRSGYLALEIQRALAVVRGERYDRGAQQAAFDVLLGLQMPGVLVEVGFIDHPVEGPELAHPATQHRIAGALARGIVRFLEQPLSD